MSGQRRFLKVWARTVGMPIGVDDDDKPEFLPITQTDVKKSSSVSNLLDCITCGDLCSDYSGQW